MEYIMDEFLPDEARGVLKDDTPLMTGSILDSIGIVKLVIFLEETYGVDFQADEVSVATMDTVSEIARIVQVKTEGSA